MHINCNGLLFSIFSCKSTFWPRPFQTRFSIYDMRRHTLRDALLSQRILYTLTSNGWKDAKADVTTWLWGWWWLKKWGRDFWHRPEILKFCGHLISLFSLFIYFFVIIISLFVCSLFHYFVFFLYLVFSFLVFSIFYWHSYGWPKFCDCLTFTSRRYISMLTSFCFISYLVILSSAVTL